MEKHWGLQVIVYRTCLAWGRHSVHVRVITGLREDPFEECIAQFFTFARWALNPAPFPSPWDHALNFSFPARTASLSSRMMLLFLLNTAWLQGSVKIPAQNDQLPPPPMAPRKPQGAEAQGKMKPERKEGACTPTTKEAFSCPDQILLLPQKSAQSSLSHVVHSGPRVTFSQLCLDQAQKS